ncbi:MAG: L,D-transpeptidase [Verrucomicrobium sp.]|nr:L,D-transpeptidase [Verrucomicrobium sp.]
MNPPAIQLQSSLLLLIASICGMLMTSCTTTTAGGSGQPEARYLSANTSAQSAFLYGKKKFHDARNKVMGFFRGGSGSGAFWDADDMTGRPAIRIDLGDQMVYFYKGGQLAGGSPISSGAEGYATRPGTYRIIEKDIDHKSSIYGDYEDYSGNVIAQNIDNRKDPKPPGTRFEGAKMYYFMRIYGGVGMHKGYLPGYAASHGCIRLPERMAEKFYNATPMGTPVTIVP